MGDPGGSGVPGPARGDVPPRVAVLSVAGGLALMAILTVGWTSLTIYGWSGAAAVVPPVVAAVAALVFLGRAVLLGLRRKWFPVLTTPEDVALGRRMGIGYGIVFGAEGLVIGVVAGVLGQVAPDYVVPAIALVVGLHFAPMARIFARTIDYWIAAWVCVAAVVGIALIAGGGLAVPQAWSLVGVATGLGTFAYGVYMVLVSAPWLAAVSARG